MPTVNKYSVQGPPRQKGQQEGQTACAGRGAAARRMTVVAERPIVRVGQPGGSTGVFSRALPKLPGCAELKFENPVERPLPRTSERSPPPRRLRTPELGDTRRLEAVTLSKLCDTVGEPGRPAPRRQKYKRRRRVQSTHPIRAAVPSTF